MSAGRVKHNRPSELIIGPLPSKKINKTLELELEEGVVVFSVAAQLHASRKHGDEYARCLPFVGGIIADPLYVGDDDNNPGKIELIGRAVSLGTSILVAVSIDPDDQGRYHVTSLYPVSHKKVEGRRRKGFLSICK